MYTIPHMQLREKQRLVVYGGASLCMDHSSRSPCEVSERESRLERRAGSEGGVTRGRGRQDTRVKRDEFREAKDVGAEKTNETGG